MNNKHKRYSFKPLQEIMSEVIEKQKLKDLNGPVGGTGKSGEKGEKGTKGKVGSKGDRGYTGDKGDGGIVGESGESLCPNGDKGNIGNTGDIGLKSLKYMATNQAHYKYYDGNIILPGTFYLKIIDNELTLYIHSLSNKQLNFSMILDNCVNNIIKIQNINSSKFYLLKIKNITRNNKVYEFTVNGNKENINNFLYNADYIITVEIQKQTSFYNIQCLLNNNQEFDHIGLLHNILYDFKNNEISFQFYADNYSESNNSNNITIKVADLLLL